MIKRPLKYIYSYGLMPVQGLVKILPFRMLAVESANYILNVFTYWYIDYLKN